MNLQQPFSKRITHLIFVGAFLLVLAFNITIGLTSGQSFLDALWTGVGEIRPMEYAMFAALWYACAVHKPQDTWNSSLIALNLADRK